MSGDTTDPIEEELRAVLRELHGPVPDAVVAAARGAWTWRTVDAELAELLEEDAVAVRSGTAVVRAYAVAGVVIDVEVDGDVVLGQVGDAAGTPLGASVVVDVAAPDGTRHAVDAEVDAAGGFRATVPAGNRRIAVSLPDGRRIVTPWLGAAPPADGT